MSQAQSQSKPPPLREVLFQAEAVEAAKDKVQFYDELYAAEESDVSPPLTEEPSTDTAPAPTEVRAGYQRAEKAAEEPLPRQEPVPVPAPIEGRGSYRRTGNNVYQLDNLWQNAPAHLAENGPKGARPRPVRRPKHVPVKKHYRVGRAIATLFAMLGWLMILAALAVSSISLLQPVLVDQFGAPYLLGGVAGSLFAGLLTVSIGLAARAQFDASRAQFDATRAQFEATRAQFDQADAARELVALERARTAVAQY